MIRKSSTPPLIRRGVIAGRRRGAFISTISLNYIQSRRRNLVVLACRKRMETKRIEKEPKKYFAKVMFVVLRVKTFVHELVL